MPEQTVHVVDDDPAMRESLAFLLDSAGLTAATYESGPALLAKGTGLEAGCIVTDVRMPQMSGLELVRALKDAGLDHPVVVITGHGDIPLAVEAMREGVLDFLEKPFDDEVLLAAVRKALDQARAETGKRAETEAARVHLEGLSARERDVLGGLVAGKANKVIAYDLGISPRTVEIYRANVMTKTGAKSLSELVRMALLAGFS
jgi:two-component system, LuxR family, response regulator FixJ